MQRLKAYLAIGLSYIAACVAGWFVFTAICEDNGDLTRVILGLFAADAAATVIIWLFGLAFRNSSFYDPYWSFMPWMLILALMIRFDLWNGMNIFLLIALGIWSWRLTVNWAYTCENITTQDWRYVMFKQQNKPLNWHVINLFGINMMPTVLVFIALIPAIVTVSVNASFNLFALFGGAVIVFGTILEFFADLEMHRFRTKTENRGEIIDRGLWKYSRHPNYLGEITVWFGVYFVMLAATTAYWYFFVGAILIFALFFFISIPMMEKRQTAKRASYANYIRTTSKLLLLPHKHK